MRIVIFGLGSIGERHALLLKANFPEHEIFAYRTHKGKGNGLGIPELFDWAGIDALKPELAFICTPTHTHIPLAVACAERGMHLFMEKPLSHQMEGIRELNAIIEQRQLTAYVAYGLRFHPVIVKIKELIQGKTIHHVRVVCASYLHRWRPQAKERNYSYYKDQGGGVILDVSHEFDYVQYLFGPIASISGRHGRICDVTVDAEDYCDALIMTAHQVAVSVHLNLFSLDQERHVTIEAQGATIRGDLLTGEVRMDSDKGQEVTALKYERDDWMLDQTRYFLNHMDNPQIMNNTHEAAGLLEKILEFRHG